MSLREILENMVENDDPVLLVSGGQEYEASNLLQSLHKMTLRTPAHLQSGLYIAAINEGGYLGEVLYKLKQK